MKYTQSLSARLKLLTLLWVSLAVASIVLTLLLSWRLEGGAAAINDTGSLRMQTYRLGLLVYENRPAAEINQKIERFDATLATLVKGDPSRPLFLPPTAEVQTHMAALQRQWQQEMKPMFQAASNQPQAVHNERLQQFVAGIDELVLAVEAVNARNTEWLRLFQSGLLAMVLLSAGVMVVLLYLWIIKPLEALQRGVVAIHDGDFGVQVPRDKATEFAQVDDGFNQMSTRLQQLYTNLEQQVADKTRDLADKNYTLETLYFFLHFLNQTTTIEAAAQGFLSKIMAIVPAQAGSVRLIDFQRQRMDLVAQTGLPEALQSAEACQRLDDCFCGQAVQSGDWQPIRFGLSMPDGSTGVPTGCEKFGFQYLHLLHIRHNEQELGVMALYFDQPYSLATATSQLLNALCLNFGVAVTNIRLAEESRQLAVLQERNLMAQGLHDSIAQTLTFLNLQVQMLESALAAQQREQAAENVQFIKDGVQECYEDVRELLLNFRTKISRKEFTEAVRTLAQRFEQQTRVATSVRWQGTGPPLNAEQQLQFIFILQESLSNIRKHAHAGQVNIEFDNQHDFTMTISDNGCGFDTAALAKLSGSHVGLGIMRERALRIRAELSITSQPDTGSQVRLCLPHQERNLA